MPLSLVFLILNPSSTQLREANQALKNANRELVELRAPRIQLENERDALASALKVGPVSLLLFYLIALSQLLYVELHKNICKDAT